MADQTASAVSRLAAVRVRRSGQNDALWAIFFLAPMAVGLTAFYLGPIVATLYYSFTHIGVFGGSKWVGLANYAQVVTSPKILRALTNTLFYTFVILCSIPISLVIAALLEKKGLRLVWLFRLMFFLPVITLPVAIGWLWKIMLNGNYGVINGILQWFGVAGQPWLVQPSTALAAISIVGVWASIGYPVVLFVAALKGVPRDLYEAAEIDGAGPIRRFFSITVPLVSPTIFFVAVLTMIGALQMFDLVYVMIGDHNPAISSTQTVIYLFYRTAFVENDKGLASAIVFSLMVVVMLLTALQFRLQRRWVHYG